MASAQTCHFDERLSKMTQREIDVDLCVDNEENEETAAGYDNEDKAFDESTFNSEQFSNNATTPSIPVTAAATNKQTDDTCKEKAFEEDATQKNQTRDSEQKSGEYVCNDGSNTESPGITSQDDETADDTADDTDYVESNGDERIACIEEEYIQRISVLEQRHSELENVLERLTTAVECGISKPHEHGIEVEEVSLGSEEEHQEKPPAAEAGTKETEAEKIERGISRSLIIDLFVEFQHKIRDFAQDLNGVLNCSEAAIRHARVVQEWATSVQLMFEQLKEERHKILGYIDERERNMLIIKEQFIAELEEQGKILKQLVEEMMSHHELQQQGEDYCKTKAVGETPNRRSTVEKIVDLLLKRRLEEDKSIILNLSKQSKISELKLFIIHQQSCIQQLQEQNKELRAIIEGLMGPDDLEEEDPCDTDQTGTPASSTNLDQASVRDSLLREDSPTVSLVSDVLYCDRGEYLPGTSTDGDVATVQAYNIGGGCEEINSGEEIVFDPLSVNYVREQCQHAEETERQAHLEVNNAEARDELKVESDNPSGGQEADENKSGDEKEVHQVSDNSGVISEQPSKQDNVQAPENHTADVNLLDEVKTSQIEDVGDGKPQLSDEKGKDNAAGDSVDVTADKGISSEQTKELEVV